MSEEEFGVDWRGWVVRVLYGPIKLGKKDIKWEKKQRMRQKGHDFHQLFWNPVRGVELTEGKAQSEGFFAHFDFELWKVWQHGSAMAQKKKNEVMVLLSREREPEQMLRASLVS